MAPRGLRGLWNSYGLRDLGAFTKPSRPQWPTVPSGLRGLRNSYGLCDLTKPSRPQWPTVPRGLHSLRNSYGLRDLGTFTKLASSDRLWLLIRPWQRPRGRLSSPQHLKDEGRAARNIDDVFGLGDGGASLGWGVSCCLSLGYGSSSSESLKAELAHQVPVSVGPLTLRFRDLPSTHTIDDMGKGKMLESSPDILVDLYPVSPQSDDSPEGGAETDYDVVDMARNPDLKTVDDFASTIDSNEKVNGVKTRYDLPLDQEARAPLGTERANSPPEGRITVRDNMSTRKSEAPTNSVEIPLPSCRSLDIIPRLMKRSQPLQVLFKRRKLEDCERPREGKEQESEGQHASDRVNSTARENCAPNHRGNPRSPVESGSRSVAPVVDKGKNPLEGEAVILPPHMFKGGPTVAVHTLGDPPTIECPILEEFATQLNKTDSVKLMSVTSMAYLMHLRKLREELVQARAERDQALLKKVALEEKSQQI
ncbi:OLC1v1036218C1 [Oldenlandia corymbosa var. corymbosa]|uniref:OLC1v1036218C1 n=1 Tax=Oldenlandia corymbosa var. corymbosa TaxID=529605 RepID=A0AAV1CY03_OLDCO|nr:OLC1v1036218C1 [Oldenlandia corymbosa var. corymbosa]